PTAPLSAYGADKRACELHARIAGSVHGIPTLGLRFFNLYGPRQDPRSQYSGVIAIFADRLARGEPVEIFGDGQQIRDFTYVGMPSRLSVELCRRRILVLRYSTSAPARGPRCKLLPRPWLPCTAPSSSPIIGRRALAKCGCPSETRAKPLIN